MKISTTRWNESRDQITRGELAYQVAKKVKRYFDAMVVSSHGGIVRLALLKIKLQQGSNGSAPWKIGEGFMHLDNMFLVGLESVSKGSWQPEIWVADPTMY